MKRGPKPSDNNGQRDDLVKKTFLFPRTTSQNLAVAALALGVEQADIVREAVDQKLVDMGLNVKQSPLLPNVRDVDNLVNKRR